MIMDVKIMLFSEIRKWFAVFSVVPLFPWIFFIIFAKLKIEKIIFVPILLKAIIKD